MAINKISPSRKKDIEKITAKGLPDNPTQQGYSPEMIKKRLSGAVPEIIDEVNRIVEEIIIETTNIKNSITGIGTEEIHVGETAPTHSEVKIWFEI